MLFGNALKEYRVNKWENGTILFDLWVGESHAGREHKLTPHLYRNKDFFKTKDLKEKQLLLPGWYYRPNDQLKGSRIRHSIKTTILFSRTTEHMNSDQAVMINLQYGLKYGSVPLI